MNEKELNSGAEMLKSIISRIDKLKNDNQLTGNQEVQLLLIGGLMNATLDIAHHLTRIANALQKKTPAQQQREAMGDEN